MITIGTTSTKRGPAREQCGRCFSTRLGPNRCDEMVCYDCGVVKGPTLEGEVTVDFILAAKTYKRVFYFNERCARWTCNEPRIEDDIWLFIKAEGSKSDVYGPKKNFKRETISKILRNCKLSFPIITKHKSRKFRCNPLTRKRFYDKYYEKWKSTLERFGVKVKIPDHTLVDFIKNLFMACLNPFELFRHNEGCTKVFKCSKFHGCMYKFINYDYIFRKLLQIAERQFGYEKAFEQFKDDFVLVSKKIREKKLKPIFQKICLFNDWQYYEDD